MLDCFIHVEYQDYTMWIWIIDIIQYVGSFDHLNFRKSEITCKIAMFNVAGHSCITRKNEEQTREGGG